MRHRPSTFVTALLATLVVCIPSCLPGGRLPELSRSGGLATKGRALRPDAGPFRVIFAGPEGEDIDSPQLQIVWSRPVRALGQRLDEPRIDARITPEVVGKWEWMGTNAARFVAGWPADAGFRQATRYTLEVAPGVRSIDGEVTTTPVRLSFATRGPTLESSEPHAGQQGVELDAALSLRFDQTIPRSALERTLSVVDRAGRQLPFLLEQQGADAWNESVQLKPHGRWPEGELLTVKLAGGMVGSVGDVPMKPKELSFETTLPLQVTEIDCFRHEDARCVHATSLHVQLNDHIRPSDLTPLVRITPSVKLKPPSDRSDAPSDSHHLEGDFRVGVKYQVVVEAASKPPRPLPPPRKGQEARELRQLKVGATADFVFAPVEPSVHFSFGGTYLAPSNAELAARAEDTTKAMAGAVGLDRAMVMRLAAGEDNTPWWDLAGMNTLTLPVRNSAKDPPAWQSLRELTPTAPGPVLFGARWDFDGVLQQQTAVLQRSALALYARVSPEGTLAWVTSLETGEPVEGAVVEARDVAGHSVVATTAGDGVALLASEGVGTTPASTEESWRKPGAFMVLFAQRGEDWIYQRVEIPRRARMRGTVFTDRGLYRPGEAVHLKGVVRQPTSKGLVPVEGKPAAIEVRDPTGRVTRSTEKLTPWGTFTHDLQIASDVPVGRYSVSVLVDDQRVAEDRFQVMEYRPSTFSVESELHAASGPDKPAYLRGEQVVCKARGRYLHGGSLEGSHVIAHVHGEPARHEVPGLAGYTIEDRDRRSLRPEARQIGIIDRSGSASFSVSAGHAAQRGAERISCEVTVTDAGQDQVMGSSSVLVHPGEVYVALKEPASRHLLPEQILRPTVLTVTPEGVRRSKPVHIELLQHLRDPHNGARLPPTVVASCDVTSGAEPKSCAFSAPRGPYGDVAAFVIRATANDPSAPVTASVELYPSTRRMPVVSAPRVLPRKTKASPHASLSADRDRFDRGQVAHLKATSPFAKAQLLLTVEREGVLEHRVLPVTQEPVELDVLIGDASAPFVTAVATFVSPLGERATSTGKASTSLQTGFDDHKLQVTVRPSKTQATPGEELDVEVEVRTVDGRPARTEVTLYAADEGTLNLANYRLPDPLSDFLAGLDHTVAEGHTRNQLASLVDWQEELRAWARGERHPTSRRRRLGGSHRTKAPHLRMGETSVSLPRQNFQQGAFFLPALTTDEGGVAHAHVKLPESLTTYRVMAFAVTKGAELGAGQATIVTSMPLGVRPVLPRVIRAGDAFAIGAMAVNGGSTATDATVTLELAGLSSQGPSTQTVKLGPGESRRLTFPVEARVTGRGHVVLRIAGGDHLADAAELPIEVVAPVAMEAAGLSGVVRGRVDEELGDLAGLRPDTGSLELTLSASPIAGLGAGLEQLVTYPYGCTEQTTSRLVPLLPLRELARALAVPLPADLDAASQGAVQRILGNQQKDGGFGLWSGSKGSSAWLSVYATWGLEEAKRHGVPVDAKALGRARQKLLSLLDRWGDGSQEKATAPFALDVAISAIGEDGVDAGSLRVLADQMFHGRGDMPVFSKALLLHAMGKLESEPRSLQALIAEVVSMLHMDGPLARFVGADPAHLISFDSGTRTGAIVLRALLAVAPEHPMVTPLALGLVNDRSGGTWRTTQETAWALLALDDYRRRQGELGPLEGQVLLGGVSLFHHAFVAGGIAPDARKTLPMAQVFGAAGRDLSFLGQGGAPIQYHALLRFAPSELPTTDVASGFSIQRRFMVIPQQAQASTSAEWRVDVGDFAEGALILSEITVATASTRRHVVIDAPLAGGVEAVNPELPGVAYGLRGYVHGGATRTEHRDDRALFFVDELPAGAHTFTHVVRATAAGRFVVPPARVEEMYTPETFGRTGARVITIR